MYQIQSPLSDVYPLAYNFKNIGVKESIPGIVKISKMMTAENPNDRYDLQDCSIAFLKY